jgi:hypothetical protein
MLCGGLELIHVWSLLQSKEKYARNPEFLQVSQDIPKREWEVLKHGRVSYRITPSRPP